MEITRITDLLRYKEVKPIYTQHRDTTHGYKVNITDVNDLLPGKRSIYAAKYQTTKDRRNFLDYTGKIAGFQKNWRVLAAFFYVRSVSVNCT